MEGFLEDYVPLEGARPDVEGPNSVDQRGLTPPDELEDGDVFEFHSFYDE